VDIEIEIHGNIYRLKVDLPEGDFNYLRLVDKLEPSTSSLDDMFAKLSAVSQQNQKIGILGKDGAKYLIPHFDGRQILQIMNFC
jgi:hypothetical protein